MISKKHHEVGMCRRGSEASIACLLNRKLGVLHVALVLLEQRVDPRQLFQYLRQRRSIDALWDPVLRAASLMFCGARMLAHYALCTEFTLLAARALQDAPRAIASPARGLAKVEFGDKVLGRTGRDPKLRRDHAGRDDRPGQHVVEERRQF